MPPILVSIYLIQSGDSKESQSVDPSFYGVAGKGQVGHENYQWLVSFQSKRSIGSEH